MVTPVGRWPELPYLHRPGCCPRCGMDIRPEPDRVVLGGSWLKPDGKGGFTTTGQLVSYQCPQCGTDLLSVTDGWPKWDDIDPRQLRWCPAPPAPG
jgi:hypothetical protein